jgi:hypothetical protein
MFFEYHQNNSGGRHSTDKNIGVDTIIEADSAQEANDKFKNLGGYFDGVRDGRDCQCCGDRWYERCEEDATVAIDEDSMKVMADPQSGYSYSYVKYVIVVHFKSGMKISVKGEGDE